jgi:DNA-binding response OmpR family regulator
VPFPATTLQEARRLTRDETFDLILIDLNLPDGNGWICSTTST